MRQPCDTCGAGIRLFIRCRGCCRRLCDACAKNMMCRDHARCAPPERLVLRGLVHRVTKIEHFPSIMAVITFACHGGGSFKRSRVWESRTTAELSCIGCLGANP